MNIGLNLVGFIPGTMGGIETYLRNLVHSLQIIDRDNSMSCYVMTIMRRTLSYSMIPPHIPSRLSCGLAAEFCGTRP